MDERLFYPAVALLYFAVLSWESRGDRLILGTAASLNVFCLFVLAQPYCLSLGGIQGVVIYVSMAYISYRFLPRQKEKKARTVENMKEQDKSKKNLMKRKEAKKE